MGKVYTRFQTKKTSKTVPHVAPHTDMAYIKEYAPRSPLIESVI